jgi:hypothetical protein
MFVSVLAGHRPTWKHGDLDRLRSTDALAARSKHRQRCHGSLRGRTLASVPHADDFTALDVDVDQHPRQMFKVSRSP